jgi:hypothetical protein
MIVASLAAHTPSVVPVSITIIPIATMASMMVASEGRLSKTQIASDCA